MYFLWIYLCGVGLPESSPERFKLFLGDPISETGHTDGVQKLAAATLDSTAFSPIARAALD